MRARGSIRRQCTGAAFAGVSPLEASSGRITRHRLSRFGDRELNRALHVIINWRMLHDRRTRDYLVRRRADRRLTPKSAAASSATQPGSSSGSWRQPQPLDDNCETPQAAWWFAARLATVAGNDSLTNWHVRSCGRALPVTCLSGRRADMARPLA
jgi:hypothetical protein